MKTQRTVTFATCDFCPSKEGCYQTCRKCGKDVCYNCQKQVRSQMHCESSGDPTFCQGCYAEEVKSSTDPVFLACLAVVRLRNEMDGWYEEFKKRQKEVEGRAERLVNEMRR